MRTSPGSQPFCKVQDCSGPYEARGYCVRHYKQFKKRGLTSDTRQNARGNCIVASCDDPHEAKGYCMRHYYRYRFNGGPDILKNAPPGTGTINTAGYRIIYVSGRRRREHDVIAEREIIHRPLMPDEVVHHINKNRLDNRIENLAVMTRKAHMAMHRAEQLKAGTS